MAYKAPGLDDDNVSWLLQEVRSAQSALDQRIEIARNLPLTEPSRAKRIIRLNQMKREVDSVFTTLTTRVDVWSQEGISALYEQGFFTAATQLSSGYSLTLPHRNAIEQLAKDAYSDVGSRLLQVRDGFSSTVELQKMFESLDPVQLSALRADSRSAVAQILLTGEDPRIASKKFADSLWANGINIIDSSGRQWNPEAYSRMLIRTKSANAYNAGSLNKYAEERVSRVRVFDGVEDDQECADANGQIWTLDYAMEHVIAHPNCRRAFAPELGKGAVDRKNPSPLQVLFAQRPLQNQSISPSIDALKDTALFAKRVALSPTTKALIEFRRSGELNLSDPLSRFLADSVVRWIGVEIPGLDRLVKGAFGQIVGGVDAVIESYIDPVLFASGLIKNIPSRATVAAMKSDNPLRELVESVVESIEKARTRDIVGEPGRPGLSRLELDALFSGSATIEDINKSPLDDVIVKLNEILDNSERIVANFNDQINQGALGYVRFVADELLYVRPDLVVEAYTNRVGSLVGDILWGGLFSDDIGTTRRLLFDVAPQIEPALQAFRRYRQTGDLLIPPSLAGVISDQSVTLLERLLSSVESRSFLELIWHREIPMDGSENFVGDILRFLDTKGIRFFPAKFLDELPFDLREFLKKVLSTGSAPNRSSPSALGLLNGLAKFRETGELRVSTTLADLVLSPQNPLIDEDLHPLLDQYGSAALRFFATDVDRYLETYVDPILYAAELIKAIPARSEYLNYIGENKARDIVGKLVDRIYQVRYNLRPAQNILGDPAEYPVAEFLLRLESRISLGERLFEKAKYGIGGVLVAKEAVDQALRIIADPREAMELLDQLIATVRVDRYGQIFGEFLLSLKRGEVESIKESFQEAAQYIDGLKDLKRRHRVSMNLDRDQALELWQKVTDAKYQVRVLLESDSLPENVRDAGVEFVELFGTQLSLTRSHLIDFGLELEEMQFDLFQRINQLNMHMRGGRDFGFPLSAGPVGPSDAGLFWDLDDFARDSSTFLDTFLDIRGNLRKALPLTDITFVRETGASLRKVLDEGDQLVAPIMRGIRGNMSPEEFAFRLNKSGEMNSSLRYRMLNAGALLKEDATFIDEKKFLRVLSDELEALEFDPKKGAVLYRNNPIDSEELERVTDAIDWLENAFSDLSLRANPLAERILFDVFRRSPSSTNPSRGWELLVGNLHKLGRDSLAQTEPLNKRSMFKFFENRFKYAKWVGTDGLNGTPVIVTLDNGQQLFVKPFRAFQGGIQGPSKSAAASVLHPYVARRIGDVEAPPARLWSFVGDDGPLFGVVNPALSDDVVNYAEATTRGRVPGVGTSFEMPADAARRHAFLDLITQDVDGNSHNYMVDNVTGALVRVDPEAAFFETSGKWVSNHPVNQLKFLSENAWEAGGDLDIGAPPVRFVLPTNNEVNRIRPGTNRTSMLGDLPLIRTNDGFFVVPTGRVGNVGILFGRDEWIPKMHLNDAELEWVLVDLETRTDEFRQVLQDQFEDLDEIVLQRFAQDLGVADPEDAIEFLARDAARKMDTHIDDMIERGVIDISGGISEYTNVNGLSATVGEKIRWADDAGGGGSGTVFDIIERRDGSIFARVMNGFGDELPLEELNQRQVLVTVELSSPSIRATDDVLEADFSVHLRRQIEDQVRLADTLEDHAADVGSTVVYEQDEITGLLRPTLVEHTKIENYADSQGSLHVTGQFGTIRTGLSTEAKDRLTKIVIDELEDVRAGDRPLRIRIVTGVLRTSDGKRAFGTYLADERLLQVSVTSLFPTLQPDDLGRILFESREQMADLMDVTGFRGVFRHEIGHARVVGMELRWRQRTSGEVLEQIIKGNSDLKTEEDFMSFARAELTRMGRADLIPDDPRKSLAALVEFRVNLLEDIENSNRVRLVQRIARDYGLPDSVSPVVQQRILRGDPDAYHELLADILVDHTSFRSWALNVVAPGVPKNQLDEFANLLLDSTSTFDYAVAKLPQDSAVWSDPQRWNRYLDDALNPDRVFVPVNRSDEYRQYWQQVDLPTETLIERARKEDGGFTFDIITEKDPPRGWSVAHADNEQIIENFDQVSDEELAQIFREYAAKHEGLLSQAEWFLGGWHDSKNNLFYLDTSQVFRDEAAAAHFGFEQRQRSMVNLGAFRDEVDENPYRDLLDAYDTFEEYLAKEIPEYQNIKDILVDVMQESTKTRQTLRTDELGRYAKFERKSIIKPSRRAKWQADYDAKKVINVKTGEEIPIDKESIKKRLETILIRAEDELKENPSFQERLNFYVPWNQGYRELSAETGIPFRSVVAAAAGMSPGLDAEVNYDVTLWLTRQVASHRRLTEREARIIREYLDSQATDYRKYASEANSVEKRLEKLAISAEFEDWKKYIEQNVDISTLPAPVLHKVLHALRKIDSVDTPEKFETVVREGIARKKKTKSKTYPKVQELLDLIERGELPESWEEFTLILYNPGLPNQRGQVYVDGIMVLRGEMEADEILGDVKVRSFANNIMDPLNVVGQADVTVDFHMMDMALGGNTNQTKRIKKLADNPGMDGIFMGLRIIIAEAVRELYDEGWDVRVGAESPAKLQEKLWGTWKRGKELGWWGEIPIVKEIQ